jgi:hypothetical protein
LSDSYPQNMVAPVVTKRCSGKTGMPTDW